MKKSILFSSFKFILIASLIFVGYTSAPAKTTTPTKENPIVWRAQSAWMTGLGNHEDAVYFAKMVNKLSGGRLVIDKMRSAGEIVGSFEALPAASKGKLDLTHSTTVYMTGTVPGATITVASPYINSALELVTWYWYGGGIKALNEAVQTKYNLYVLPTSAWEAPVLWSRKPIRTIKDLKGLKVRSYGLIMDVFKRMGAASLTMPMSEVVPAMERGVLDALHMLTLYQAYPAHLYDVCKYALTGATFTDTGGIEVYINLDKWKALPDDLKEVVELAAKQTMFWSLSFTIPRNIGWMQEVKKSGCIVSRASPELERDFLKVRLQQAKDWMAKDPIAKRLISSAKEWSEKWEAYMDLCPTERKYR